MIAGNMLVNQLCLTNNFVTYFGKLPKNNESTNVLYSLSKSLLPKNDRGEYVGEPIVSYK